MEKGKERGSKVKDTGINGIYKKRYNRRRAKKKGAMRKRRGGKS